MFVFAGRMSAGFADGKLLRSPALAVASVVPFLLASAPRGRRCPLGAHTGAVSASLRLRCGARPDVASPNSLRSLRSLRSNIRDESDHEARCARRHQGSAPRRPTDRPQRALPAALDRGFSGRRKHAPLCKGAPGQATQRLDGAEKRKARGLARSAIRKLTRRGCLNAANAVSAVSSATGHEPEHLREVGATRRPPAMKRSGLSGRAFAAPTDAQKTEPIRAALSAKKAPTAATAKQPTNH